MSSKDKSNMLHHDRRLSERSTVPVRLGWAAIGPCLVVAGCGASPDTATTGHGEQVAQAKQALAGVTDVSLQVLGKCLDVPAFNDTNGTDVQIYDCNGGANQQWEFWSDGTVRPTFNTNKCLDLPGWETADGTPIQIYDCHGGSNQQWALINNEIQGYGSKCVDDPGFSTGDGTNLQYYDCNGGFNQVFTLAPPAGGPSQFWNLKAEEDNVGPDQEMCMGVAGGVLGSGYPFDRSIIVWDCNGSPDQTWTRTFQSDRSGQSGVVDLVDGSLGMFEGEPGYPVCLWDEDIGLKPFDGLQMTTEYCPNQGANNGGFVFNYVQNDAFGYPCFTIQNPQSGLYVGVANAQANPVQNGMPIIFWDRTPSDDQVWCDHSSNTGFFTVTPDFVITNVIYAPPGKSSTMQYSATTSVGSALTSTKSFQNSTDVTASVSVGPMAMSSLAGDSASVTANHTFGDSDAKEVDLTTTWAQGNKKPGETNGIDHDWDEIWFVVHPILNVSFTPGTSGAPDETNWQFSQGDGETTAVTGFAYAGELNNDIPLSAQNQQLFSAFNITPDMYPTLLQADAFFHGIAPTPGMDTDRFDYINEFPYQPPPTPLGPGQMASTQPYTVTQSNSTSDTTTSSYSDSVGVTVSGGFNAGVFRTQFTASSKWTWTHSSSDKESTGTGSMDALTVGQPDFGYAGPGLLHVYEDRIFKTYAFTLDYAGAIPFTDDGGYQCDVGGVGMHCCPPGNAMVGIRLDQNVFKCAQLQDTSGPIVADFSTYRNVNLPNPDGTSTPYNMHTCPPGYVMVGLREDQNVLACQQIPANAISDALTGERVDLGTEDTYPMHVCESTPRAYAMSGFDGPNNLLACATNPGLK